VDFDFDFVGAWLVAGCGVEGEFVHDAGGGKVETIGGGLRWAGLGRMLFERGVDDTAGKAGAATPRDFGFGVGGEDFPQEGFGAAARWGWVEVDQAAWYAREFGEESAAESDEWGLRYVDVIRRESGLRAGGNEEDGRRGVVGGHGLRELKRAVASGGFGLTESGCVEGFGGGSVETPEVNDACDRWTSGEEPIEAVG
jgi:hypothetical protein